MPLSTTQYGFIIDPMVPFTDAYGTTIRNGYVRVFVAGSSTPVITYKNYDGATNEETIQLDNSGRTAYPVIVSKGNTYKVCVYDAEHSQESPILTIDKVVPAGANVEATNIVTGLDNVESPEAGWVKSTVSGTDAEVSLDATNVTSEVDTLAKATAASADYMMPLVHKTGSDPDKKITLGNIFKFVLNFIHSLTDTATEADLTSGNYLALDGSAGTKKLNSTMLLTKTAQNALAGNVAPEFVPNSTTTVAGQLYVYDGSLFEAKESGYQGAWDDSKFIKVDIESKLVKKTKINLFDKTAITENRYLANGIPSYLSGYFTSDWIEVKAGARLKFIHGFITALYDATKTFIQNKTGIDILIPNGVAYIRTCDKNEFLDSLQVGYDISADSYKSHDEEQVENFIDINKVLNAPPVKIDSLINLTGAEDGKYLNNDGSKGSNSSFMLTNYIPVNEGYFSSKYLFNYAFYFEDFTLSRVTSLANTTIGSTEKYVRITINKDNLYKIQASNGVGVPTIKTDYKCCFDEKGNATNSYESYDVAVGPSGCNFTTISEALAAITDASPKKRYRIIVAEGTYEETFKTKDYVDIIGKNRYKCIVNYTTADEEHYENYSTIFATSNTTIENLTITTKGAKYPVHSDAAFGRDYKLVIKDCTLEHKGFVGGMTGGTALGIGLYHGQHIEVINCRLIAWGTFGGASCYCHNSNAENANQAAFRSLKLDGVILEGGSYGLRLQSLGTNASFAQKDECVLKNIISSSGLKDIYYEPKTLDEWVIENFTNLVIEN